MHACLEDHESILEVVAPQGEAWRWPCTHGVPVICEGLNLSKLLTYGIARDFGRVMTELEEGNAACRLEAAWVFLNMCQCGFEVHETIIPSMVEHGLLSAVCHSLDKQEEPG